MINSNRLISAVRLPYKFSSGSINVKQRKADAMVNKLYKTLVGRFDHGEMKISELKNCINEVLPKKVRILVLDTDIEGADGFSDVLYSKNNKIYAITLEMPTENQAVKIKDIPTILHEFQHLSDQLFHPKILARGQNLTSNNKMTSKYNELYDSIYEIEDFEGKRDKQDILKQIKYDILKFFKGMKNNDKINYLQDIRYSLITENNAYYTQRKYAKKLKKKHFDINPHDLDKMNNSIMLNEKIDLIKKIAGSIIKKERSRLKTELKKQNKN